MLPPCLSLEESFRKAEEKKRRERKKVFYTELGLSCEVYVQTQTSPNLGGECSALRWGARCRASWGSPKRGRKEQCGV